MDDLGEYPEKTDDERDEKSNGVSWTGMISSLFNPKMELMEKSEKVFDLVVIFELVDLIMVLSILNEIGDLLSHFISQKVTPDRPVITESWPVKTFEARARKVIGTSDQS